MNGTLRLLGNDLRSMKYDGERLEFLDLIVSTELHSKEQVEDLIATLQCVSKCFDKPKTIKAH